MRIVCDVEANRLENPDKITVVCCKDVDTGERYVFRDAHDASDLLLRADMVIGHNFIGYDYSVLETLAGIRIRPARVLDTLVVSRLVDYLRPGGHSLSEWGTTLGIKKEHADEEAEFFLEWSQELEDRCVSDVEINTQVYLRLLPYIQSDKWKKSIEVEHRVAWVCRELNLNGFSFNRTKALNTLERLKSDLLSLDKGIRDAFPSTYKLIRLVLPRETKHGTIARNSIPRDLGPDLTPYHAGSPFSYIESVPFNPASPKQIVSRLHDAGWHPTEKTKGHIEALKSKDQAKIDHFKVFGWRISDENLSTLPDTAPKGARDLAERLLIASRISDLDEWIALARPSLGEWRIHGHYNGIGAWTQRMSHARPNTANIPTRKPQDPPRVAALNDEMRTLWTAGPGCLLVGVDADQIQLRVLAHYMRDQLFIDALVNGDKEKGTDVHTLNVSAIGPVCKGRRDAKTFIYAWLLGAGVDRVADILGCNRREAKDARSRFIEYYPGLKRLRTVDIRRDARLGYFRGLDGRYVKIYGADEDERNHYALGGYLQGGEKVVMAHALVIWQTRLITERIPFKLVNFVHDEWIIETSGGHDVAVYISGVVADSIYLAGQALGTVCPMRGSINTGHDRLAIGSNWLEVH